MICAPFPEEYDFSVSFLQAEHSSLKASSEREQYVLVFRRPSKRPMENDSVELVDEDFLMGSLEELELMAI